MERPNDLQKEYQEYQSKVSEYQAEVNKDVQVYSQKLERYKFLGFPNIIVATKSLNLLPKFLKKE